MFWNTKNSPVQVYRNASVKAVTYERTYTITRFGTKESPDGVALLEAYLTSPSHFLKTDSGIFIVKRNIRNDLIMEIQEVLVPTEGT